MKTKFDPAVHDDNPPLTDDELSRMRPAREVLGDATVDALVKRQRGRPKLETPKEVVKLRLDHRVVEHYKAGGPGWQTRINDALLKTVGEA